MTTLPLQRSRTPLGPLLIPAKLGGRLDALAGAAHVFRHHFFHQPQDLVPGVEVITAAVAVWSLGTSSQQSRMKDLLERGRWPRAGLQAVQPGESAAPELHVRETGAGFAVEGHAPQACDRGAGLVALARWQDSDEAGYQHLWLASPWDDDDAHPAADAGTPRAYIQQLVGREALLGELHPTIEHASAHRRASRVLGLAACLGAVERAVSCAVQFTAERRLYGGTLQDQALVRRQLGELYLDFTATDAVLTVSTQCLHVAPSNGIALAAEMFLVRTLAGLLDRAALLLGARHYLTGPGHEIFAQLLSDVPRALSSLSNEVRIALALQACWDADASPEGRGAAAAIDQAHAFQQLRRAFDVSAPLPPWRFDLDALQPIKGFGLESILHFLGTVGSQVGSPEWPPERLAAAYSQWLVRRDAGMTRPDRSLHGRLLPLMSLADRQGRLLAAACTLGLWQFNRDHLPGHLREAGWLEALVSRLLADEPSQSAEYSALQAALTGSRTEWVHWGMPLM